MRPGRVPTRVPTEPPKRCTVVDIKRRSARGNERSAVDQSCIGGPLRCPSLRPESADDPRRGHRLPVPRRHRGAITWTDPDGTAAQAHRHRPDRRRGPRQARRAPPRVAPRDPDERPDPDRRRLPRWLDRTRPHTGPPFDVARPRVARPRLPDPVAWTYPARPPDRGRRRARPVGVPRDRVAPSGQPSETRGRQNAGGVSPQTVRHIRTTLRLALGDAVRDGLAGRNAAADAKPPYLPHRPDHVPVGTRRSAADRRRRPTTSSARSTRSPRPPGSGSASCSGWLGAT